MNITVIKELLFKKVDLNYTYRAQRITSKDKMECWKNGIIIPKQMKVSSIIPTLRQGRAFGTIFHNFIHVKQSINRTAILEGGFLNYI